MIAIIKILFTGTVLGIIITLALIWWAVKQNDKKS
jgi:hypothetical protein